MFLNHPKSTQHNYIAKCLINLDKILFSFNETVVHVYDDPFKDYVTVLEGKQQYFFKTQTEIRLQNKYYFYNYILYTKNNATLQDLLNELKRSNVWHGYESPRGKYLIFTETDPEECVRVVWSHEIIHVVVVRKVNDSCYLYQNENYFRDKKILKPHFKGICSKNGSVQFRKFPNDFQGFKIKGLYDDKFRKMPFNGDPLSKTPGLYMKPLRVMEEKLNLTMILVPQPEDLAAEYADKVVTVLSEDELYNFRSDLLVAVSYRMLHYFEHFEMSDIVYAEPQIWVLPKPAQIDNMLILLFVFHFKLWIVFVLSFVAVCLVWWGIGRYEREHTFRTLLRCSISVYSLLLGQNLHLLPKSKSLKILYLFCLIYSFYVNFYYHAKLSSMLSKPIYEKGIHSFEDLVESDVTPIINKHKIVFLSQQNNTLSTRLARKSRLHEAKLPENFVDFVWKNGSVTTTSYVSALMLDMNFKSKVDYIKSPFLMDMEATYAFRKGYPLTPLFNRFLRRIHEAGLFQKWLSEMRKYSLVESDETKVILTMEHLQGPFCLLAFGWCIGTLLFIGEIFKVSRINVRFKM